MVTVSPALGPLLEVLIIPLAITALAIIIRCGRAQPYSAGIDILVAKSAFDVAIYGRPDIWAPHVTERFKPVFPGFFLALSFISLVAFGLLVPVEALLQTFRARHPAARMTTLRQRALANLELLSLLLVSWSIVIAFLAINIAAVGLK